MAKMKALQEPKPSVIVQRYQFNLRQQATTELVAEYVAALRKLAKHCNFGDSLNEMLRDRLLCGIANPTVQKHLLAELELTLTKAVTKAQVVELAERDQRKFKQSRTLPRTFTSFHSRQLLRLPQTDHGRLSKTNHLQHFVTAVVVNIISQHVDSRLKFVITVIREATLLKFAKLKWHSQH